MVSPEWGSPAEVGRKSALHLKGWWQFIRDLKGNREEASPPPGFISDRRNGPNATPAPHDSAHPPRRRRQA